MRKNKFHKTKIIARGKRYGRELCYDNANLTNPRRKMRPRQSNAPKRRGSGPPLSRRGRLARPKKLQCKSVKNTPNRSLKPKQAFSAAKFEKAATPHGKSPLAIQI
ncbi:hypothetical protein [Campylobacter showae]|jgi:hypothetical protein|uniref:hypothetical protein n=1 Tax=Campylobacter showae TaxID=204 RepID=UPI0013D0D073|nr:hypothetical protein [Campylobacter showae]